MVAKEILLCSLLRKLGIGVPRAARDGSAAAAADAAAAFLLVFNDNSFDVIPRTSCRHRHRRHRHRPCHRGHVRPGCRRRRPCVTYRLAFESHNFFLFRCS